MSHRVAILLCFLSAATLTSSVPFGNGFGEVQAQLRQAVDEKQFLTSYNELSTSSSSPGGSATYVQGNNNAALFTLPGNGVASGVVTLQACSLFTPHVHPRANEVIIVVDGEVNMAFSEENMINVNGSYFGGRVLHYRAPKGSSLTVPQGLLHYIYNNNTCNQAQVITVFDNKDPGTISIVSQLFQLPDSVISAATGLDLVSVNLARKTANGLGLIGIDQECQKRCHGTGQAANPPNNLLTATGVTGSVSVQAAAPVSTAGR